MKNAIVTLVLGSDYDRIGSVSIPMLEEYARRTGAELIVLNRRSYPSYHIHWEKFSLGPILDTYDRALWIDADTIVHPDAPSVFDEASADVFAAFDEGKFFTDRPQEINREAEFYGVASTPEQNDRGFAYFNAGVMLTGRAHRSLFNIPFRAKSGPMSEQTYTNLQVALNRYKFKDLGIKWNCLHSLVAPASRRDVWIVHYAGWPKTHDWVASITGQMKADYANWRKK